MKTEKIKNLPLSSLLCLALALALGFTQVLVAQAGRGGISGTVSDASGAIVPGASVSVTDSATSAKLTTVTTDAGVYSFVSLAPGMYELTAIAKGFSTIVQKDVSVTLDQVSTVNFKLAVGSVNQVVTVNGTTELMDTSNSTVGQLIGSATIDRVPLLTRNVYDLIQLGAGVTPANGTPNSSSSYEIENISSGRPGVDVSSYSVNGVLSRRRLRLQLAADQNPKAAHSSFHHHQQLHVGQAHYRRR
jgi:hypothetical protein